jgi:hypothetical protein
MAKQAVIFSVIMFEETASSGTYVDYSSMFSEASIPFDRTAIESGTFGNGSAEEIMGIFDFVATLNLRPDADGVKYEKLLAWFKDGVERGIKFKIGQGAIAAANPEVRATRALLKNLPFGGARNTLASEGQITVRLNGGVTYEGSTAITLGT